MMTKLTAIHIILCGVLSAMALLMPAKAQDIETGLIGYWHFDDGNTADASSYAHPSRLDRAVEFVPGKKGRAIRFPTSQRQAPGFIVNDNPVLNRTDTIGTIAFWAKLEPATPRISQQAMFAKWHGSPVDGEYLFTLNSTPQGWRVQYTVANSDAGFRYAVHYSSCPIDSNDWFFVAMTFDRGKMLCYLNGTLDTAITAPFQSMTRKR